MSDIEKLTIESDGDITLCDKNPNTKRDILKVVHDAFVASLGHENLGSVADEILRLRAENEKLMTMNEKQMRRIHLFKNTRNEQVFEKLMKAHEKIERLEKYEQLVWFIANDYYELSHDKVKWQRNDWYKRCRKLIEEDNEDNN